MIYDNFYAESKTYTIIIGLICLQNERVDVEKTTTKAHKHIKLTYFF